ncbi:hypothetical protein [Labilibacter marinus]|uniref:hypothetical protein n=1 Tax=Labilibacter marinus TaxID=1477105 RepID=UPI00095033B5|nr:hypothetical protein [Labilibacter marinus]
MKHIYTKLKIAAAFLFIVWLSSCRKDDDLNYRIRIENHCNFALKVYYDNQEIEHFEDGDTDIDVIGAVTYVPANSMKKVYSRHRYVWIETATELVKTRKFRSSNGDVLNKEIIVHPDDFHINNGR